MRIWFSFVVLLPFVVGLSSAAAGGEKVTGDAVSAANEAHYLQPLHQSVAGSTAVLPLIGRTSPQAAW